MTDDEYNKIMQSLNVKQNEVCNHVIHWIQRREELIHSFIEDGAGVGKKVAKALYGALAKYYNTQPGENFNNLHIIITAPIGMPAYHIKGNTIQSALHIDTN